MESFGLFAYHSVIGSSKYQHSLDTRRFLKYRKTVSYFGFIFCMIIVSEFPSHPLTNKLNRLLSFCLYHLDSSFLVLLTIISTSPLDHRADPEVERTAGQQGQIESCVRFVFPTNSQVFHVFGIQIS